MRRAVAYFGCRAFTLLVMSFVLQAARSAEEMTTCECAHMQSMSDRTLRFLQLASKQSRHQRSSREKAFAALAQPKKGTVSASVSAAVALDASPGINITNERIEHAQFSLNASDTSHRGGNLTTRGIEEGIAQIALVARQLVLYDTLSDQRTSDNRRNTSARNSSAYRVQTDQEVVSSARNSSVHTSRTDHDILNSVRNSRSHDVFPDVSKDYKDRMIPATVHKHHVPVRRDFPGTSSMQLQRRSLLGNLMFPHSYRDYQDEMEPDDDYDFYEKHRHRRHFAKRRRKRKAARIRGHREELLLQKVQKTRSSRIVPSLMYFAGGAVFLAIVSFIGLRTWHWASPLESEASQEVIYGKLVVGQLAWKKDKLDKKWSKGFVTDLKPKLRITVSADPDDLSVKNGTGVGWDEVRPISSADETQPVDSVDKHEAVGACHVDT